MSYLDAIRRADAKASAREMQNRLEEVRDAVSTDAYVWLCAYAQVQYEREDAWQQYRIRSFLKDNITIAEQIFEDFKNQVDEEHVYIVESVAKHGRIGILEFCAQNFLRQNENNERCLLGLSKKIEGYLSVAKKKTMSRSLKSDARKYRCEKMGIAFQDFVRRGEPVSTLLEKGETESMFYRNAFERMRKCSRVRVSELERERARIVHEMKWNEHMALRFRQAKEILIMQRNAQLEIGC